MNKKKYIGIDIGGTAVKIGSVDEDGTIHATETYAVNFDGYETPILQTVVKSCHNFLEKYRENASEYAGIGVSATGAISTKKGVVEGTAGHIKNWINSPIRQVMEQEFHIPTEASYKKMTAVERSVADFFIGNKDDMDFSSKNISRVLYVSEATLSRFSQKCGYKGYREFIFSYERDLKFEQKSEGTEKDVGLFAHRVQNSYQKLLQENFRILDEEQVRRVAGMLNVSKRVLIFGIGNSGYAAEEFQLRFMRIGMDVNAVTDSHMMKIGAALAGEETLVIAITLSGETAEVLESIRIAKSRGASIICITAVSGSSVAKESQEVIQVAALKNLDTGTKISPQFSILAIMDVLYSYYFANDSYFKTQKYKATLSAIRAKGEHTEDKDE